MKFWDASAVIPLLVREEASERMRDLLAGDQDMLAWWGAAVECTSAIARRERDEMLDPHTATAAMERLRALASGWSEVQPTDRVRSLAQRLLRVHPLRAADSLQLAAAVAASEDDPNTLEVVCLDQRLALAAQREGLRVVS
jgi:predicted nucleic acid-binding protein